MARIPAWTRDELVLACDLVARNDWKELRSDRGDPRVDELSRLLKQLPIHPAEARRLPTFRSIGSVSRKTSDIVTALGGYHGKPTRGGKLEHEVIEAFRAREAQMRAAAALIRAGTTSGELSQLVVPAPDEVDDQEWSAPEGRLLTRRHLVRERDPRLRNQKIEKVLASGGTLCCVVCGFDFGLTYGEHGSGYIEVHHIVPLHVSGEQRTRLDDLALLCANCHRMCHRKIPGGTWPTPDELREQLV